MSQKNIKSSEFKSGQLASMRNTAQTFKSNAEEKNKTEALINLNNVNDSFSDKKGGDQGVKPKRRNSRLVLLPHGVIEDTKGEDNASEDLGTSKFRSPGKKNDINVYDIDKNSYFRDSFDGDDHDTKSEKDLFNSSLGGWDVNDEETRKKKRRPPIVKIQSKQHSLPPQ